MALPRYVEALINYDGTSRQVITETTTTTEETENTGTYTVESGDTLWGIADSYYGSGIRYTEIYDANADTIEAAAQEHGFDSSEGGHWIWPGEVFSIPGIGGSEEVTTTTTRVEVIGEPMPELGDMIKDKLSALSYTDVASGQSDTASITIADISKDWLTTYYPQKGAEFTLGIKLNNWNNTGDSSECNYGTFIIDDIAPSGRPLKETISMVSMPSNNDFKTLSRDDTWKDTTIRDIAQVIADRAGIELYYDAPDIQISEIEQNKQVDSSFLLSLCEKYGLGMKIYNHKIVIFDIVEYEQKDSVLTIDESEITTWTGSDTITGTYTGVELGYSDPDKDNTINIFIGEEGRKYYLNIQASSEYDAQLQAAAKVNEANRKMLTLSITMMANPDIVATQCIDITGLGRLNGKYYIDSIKHDITKGYSQKLTVHKVQDPIIISAPVYQEEDTTDNSNNIYIVESGDTLWGIADSYYGSGIRYTEIYDANADTIETTAQEHGFDSSDGGHWIWPGEELIIP